MTNALKIIIVKYTTEGLKETVHDTTKDDVVGTMGDIGYNTVKLNTNHRQRAELQGMPIVGSLCGPMWGGVRDGVPCIRYEDSRSNDILSV